MLSSRNPAWLLIAGFGAAALLVILARGVIDHVALYDELLHVLAARGLIETGMPVIADGIYERGRLYTQAVAWVFRYFGDGMVVARFPALVAGCLLLIVVAAWVGRHLGVLTGAVAAGLLAVLPGTLDVAVFARFYTFHAVVVLGLFIALYEATLPGRSMGTRMVLLLLAIALVPLGWSLQQTTIIALIAGLCGVGVLMLLDHWHAVRALLVRHPLLIGGTVVLLGLMAFLIAWQLGLVASFGQSPLWSAGRSGKYHYYLVQLARDMPLLWPLLPAATIVAIANPDQRRLALYCAVVSLSALILHSAAGAKALRYIYYIVPLWCVLWACATTTIFGPGAIAAPYPGVRVRVKHWVAVCVILLTVLLSQEGQRALNLLAGRLGPAEALRYGVEADWSRLAARLAPMAESADRVVTSNAMKALFFLGRYDYELSVTIVPETDTQREFGRDSRTGRQAIGSAESIRQVVERPGSTFIVLEEEKIGRTFGVPADAMGVIESHCEEVKALPREGLRAWQCVMLGPIEK